MFGIINPPSAYNNPGSASMMMPSIASQYPSTQAAMSYASNVTANSTSASMWGMNVDMSGLPSWSQSYAAENILFTQSFLAMNPETLKSDGSVDLSPLGSNAIMLPSDVAAAARSSNDSTPSSAAYPAASSTSSSASPSSTAAGDSSKNSTNGAGALSSSRAAVALVAVAAAFFAL